MFFGGQGGFPFNNGPNNSNVDNKKFYELLGVEKDAEGLARFVVIAVPHLDWKRFFGVCHQHEPCAAGVQ